MLAEAERMDPGHGLYSCNPKRGEVKPLVRCILFRPDITCNMPCPSSSSKGAMINSKGEAEGAKYDKHKGVQEGLSFCSLVRAMLLSFTIDAGLVRVRP